MREQLLCMGLCVGTSQDSMKSLWVKIGGQTDTGGVVVGICCRLRDQEGTDEAAFEQLEEAWHSQALVLGEL